VTTPNLNVALVQRACDADPEENLRACIEGIRQAASQGAKLVVLEELHNTPYFCQREDPALFDLAEPVPGPTTRRLGEVAQESHVAIVASLFERRAAGLYHNTAVVLERDGTLAGRYRKMHIPDDPGYYEKFYFTPGDLGFRPVSTSVGRLGLLVCWDQWFPEAARLMALAGAEILVYPTAIGWNPADDGAERTRQFDAWRTVQRGHAIANGLPLIACNRQGEENATTGEDRIDFWGGSFICGPQGEILAEAPHDDDTLLMASLDLGRNEDVRRIWPFFRDRRVDAYDGLLNLHLEKE